MYCHLDTQCNYHVYYGSSCYLGDCTQTTQTLSNLGHGVVYYKHGKTENVLIFLITHKMQLGISDEFELKFPELSLAEKVPSRNRAVDMHVDKKLFQLKICFFLVLLTSDPENTFAREKTNSSINAGKKREKKE